MMVPCPTATTIRIAAVVVVLQAAGICPILDCEDVPLEKISRQNDLESLCEVMRIVKQRPEGSGGKEIRCLVKDDNIMQAMGRGGENRCLSPRRLVHTSILSIEQQKVEVKMLIE